MLPDQVETYYFPPSRKRWGTVLIGAFFFVLFNAYVAYSSGQPGLYWLSGFFALFCLIAIINLVPGGGGLYLDRESFAFRFFFKERRFRWDEIGPLHPTSNGLLAHIGFRKLADMQNNDGKPKPGELLPESYGMPAVHLAALMNAWRDYALTGTHNLGTPQEFEAARQAKA